MTDLTALALVDRLLAAMPDIQEDYRSKRDDIVAEGFGANVPMFFVSEHTSELLEQTYEGNRPGREELARWLAFFEQEWGTDPEVNDFILGTVLVYMPDSYRDPHGIRNLLGPQMSRALKVARDVHSDPTEEAFLAELRRVFPELESYVEENTYGDHKALLATQFLSDVVRHVVRLHLSADPADHTRAQEIVDAVGAAHGHDPGVDNLIAVSFLEYLPDITEPGADIVRRLPPALVPLQEQVRGDLTPLRTGRADADD
ncbi:MAG: hypothetical protein ACFCVG_01430 [Kineosporiaceae bacterium]